MNAEEEPRTAATIENAVSDAFRSIGASFNETPLTPRRVSEAIDRARRTKSPAP